ncbi:hypothetical protein EKO27_g6803 [Xylaria grammica]|uniref:Uncharacterized protein n=1 Tax=Xylaria grammica TaxID=363999 RepID=A0A439D1F7_9PEZI|nr:hypothetical protein EKO27_g6803 [Xylaria grammica]
MSSRQSRRQAPVWQQRDDGYYVQVPGDGTLYYVGVDGQKYQVPKVYDMTGLLEPSRRNALQQYLMSRLFYDNHDQLVEFTTATVITDLHYSSSTDPNGQAGPHFGVQLTNPTLRNDDGRSHLLHFRPNAPEHSFFYTKSMSRKQVAKGQDQKALYRHQNKGNDKDKRGPPGGGARAEEQTALEPSFSTSCIYYSPDNFLVSTRYRIPQTAPR